MEAISEQGYTVCISALGIEFDLQVKGTSLPLLWARNALELSILGFGPSLWITLFVVVCMYQVPGTCICFIPAPVRQVHCHLNILINRAVENQPLEFSESWLRKKQEPPHNSGVEQQGASST